VILFDEVPSPVGPLAVAERAGRICLVHFRGLGDHVTAALERWYPGEPRERRPTPVATAVLDKYFAGDLASLDDARVELNGTAFQKDVWAALRRIPVGTTISYGELARRIGRRDAIRAVGAANGANPVPIIVPCHRVIGTNGSLTGFGGGLDRKRWLLAHEGVSAPTLF
jgi:methylated-DNA-[protein]-cysteine S-methyltransferase